MKLCMPNFTFSDFQECSFFGITLVFFMTHLFIDFCFLLAVVKKTIPAIAICSLIFLIDFCFYACHLIYKLYGLYVFIDQIMAEDLGRVDGFSFLMDSLLSLMITIVTLVHFSAFTDGIICATCLWLKNRESKETTLSLKEEIV